MSKDKQIAETLKNIEKQFGKGSIMKLGDRANVNVDVISSGSLLIDQALGVGGYPRGRVIEIYGPESSGKCLTADTRILTPKGYKTIEEIFMEQGFDISSEKRTEEVSIPLINKDGVVENTTHFTWNGVKEVIEIKAENHVIKPTKNHPLLVIDERGLAVWKKAGDIAVGDILIGIKEERVSSVIAKDPIVINRIKERSEINSKSTSDYTLTIVDSVEVMEPVPTFDFAMEETHTFIAEGIINHNTTLALHAVAEAQKREGARAAFIDAEHAVDPQYAKNLGVDIDELILSQPDSGEQALEIADMLIKSGSIDLIIVDSVAALVPQVELDGEMSDMTVGAQARMMSKAMRKIAGGLNNSNTTIIFINQLREKIGVMFGNPETTSGGRALKFYSSVRIDIRRSEALKEGQEIFGNKTNVRIVKNKVAPPFRTAQVEIHYGKGISRMGEVIALAVEYDIINKAGSWYSYGDDRIGQGVSSVVSYFEANPDVYETVHDLVREKLIPEKGDEEKED